MSRFEIGKYEHGYVLFAVLVFLQLFAMLGLYGVTSVMASFKVTRHAWSRHQYLHQAEVILDHLETGVVDVPLTCLIQVIPPHDLAKKPRWWWEQTTCSGKIAGMRYYYAVETLGADACGFITELQNNQSVTADYYRITLYVVSRSTTHFVLQSTVVIPSSLAFQCDGTAHKVNRGRQMRRKLV